MKTRQGLSDDHRAKNLGAINLMALLTEYGEQVKEECVAICNRAREEGETDLRQVRSWIERLELP